MSSFGHEGLKKQGTQGQSNIRPLSSVLPGRMENFAESHQDALKGVLDLSHGIASSRKIKHLL